MDGFSLSAALKALLSNCDYIFGPYVLSEDGRLLRRHDEAVPATPKVLATLLVLVKARGQAVCKDGLIRAVWPDSFVEDGNLTQNISVLRKLMAQDYPDGGAIETIPRLGYRFRPPVEMRETDGVPEEQAPIKRSMESVQLSIEPDLDVAPLVASSSSRELEEPNGTLRGWQKLLSRPRLLVASAAVVLCVLAVVFLVRRDHVSAASLRSEHPTIAVLAFTNLSGAQDVTWMSDALRETLTTDLRSDSDLRLIASDAVARAEDELQVSRRDPGKRNTVAEVCQDLDCDQVVTGAYLVSGGKVRLDTHLVDAKNGKVLSSYTAVAAQSDLLPLITQTGEAVRARLGLQQASMQSRDATRASVSKNPEAYRLYIQGLERLRQWDGRAAVDLLSRSTELDPRFALSHQKLAAAYRVIGQNSKSVAEARVALSLAQSLPREEQMEIAAEGKISERKFNEAAEIYRALYALHPDVLPYAWMMASELSYAGHAQQALDILRDLMARPEPAAHDPRFYSAASDAYWMVGDFRASLQMAREGADESRRRGANVMFERLLTSESQALLHLGQLPEALSVTRQALEIALQFRDYSGELRALNRLGQVHTAMGDIPAAEKVLQQALEREEQLGEAARQIYTLEALGENLQKQDRPAEAAAMFQRQLAMAKDYGSPIDVAQAELAVGRQDMLMGNTRTGRELLGGVSQKAVQLNNPHLAQKASEALQSRDRR